MIIDSVIDTPSFVQCVEETWSRRIRHFLSLRLKVGHLKTLLIYLLDVSRIVRTLNEKELTLNSCV